MKNKAIASGLVGLLAFGGAAAIATPIASAQGPDGTDAQVQERLQARSDRLAEKVADGTITQEQADQIAARFGDRQERRSERRAEVSAVVADLLDISTDDLVAAHQDGQSLADIAAANGVDVQIVIDALVAQANAHVDEKVADGSIDQTRADEIRANLVERITARVNGERPEPGERTGRGGPGRFGERPASFGQLVSPRGEA